MRLMNLQNSCSSCSPCRLSLVRAPSRESQSCQCRVLGPGKARQGEAAAYSVVAKLLVPVAQTSWLHVLPSPPIPLPLPLSVCLPFPTHCQVCCHSFRALHKLSSFIEFFEADAFAKHSKHNPVPAHNCNLP